MGNSITKRHFETAKKTGVLNVSNSQISEFPNRLKELGPCLRTLDLSNNKLQSIPPLIGTFTLLKSLAIDSNRLTSLPEEIGYLIKLEILSVNLNKLRDIPDSISQLVNLKEIHLSENCLASFPLALYSLKQLKIIDLSKNKITEVPGGISKSSVTELNLNDNVISLLSDDISKASKLKILRLENNQLKLSSIPITLLSESNVSTLFISGNQFDMKDFVHLNGYEKYMERYTEIKKKLY